MLFIVLLKRSSQALLDDEGRALIRLCFFEALANQSALAQYCDIEFINFLSLFMGFTVPIQIHSLELWRHALVASVRGDAPDLSARQMALILSVYLGDGPHTVRGLAQVLRISKPAVSRALDRLGELGYVRRQRDDLDRRNVLVQRTSTGAQFLSEFSLLVDTARQHIAEMPSRFIEFVADTVALPPVSEATEHEWAIEAAE